MKCARTKCPNKASPGHNRGLCGKHYDLTPVRGYVDPAATRERVALLRSRGMTLRMLQEQGVSRFGVRCIETRPRIRALTAEKVFAIPVPAPIPSGAPVDAAGTVRRLQALMWLGYTTTQIGAELGVPQNSVSAIARRTKVTAGKRAQVAALYERWCMTWGPSQITRGRALRAGWHGPMSWDDIDDPLEKPNVGVRRAVPFEERYAEMEYLQIPRSQMPKMLGIQAESLDRQLSREEEKRRRQQLQEAVRSDGRFEAHRGEGMPAGGDVGVVR